VFKLLVFENGIALVLSESLGRKQDCKIISLSRVAELRRNICSTIVTSSMGNFPQRMLTTFCIAVLANINMILRGISEQSHEQGNHQAALSKAQLLKCNSIKHGWRSTDGSVRHSRIRKHPLLPLYFRRTLKQ